MTLSQVRTIVPAHWSEQTLPCPITGDDATSFTADDGHMVVESIGGIWAVATPTDEYVETNDPAMLATLIGGVA